MLLAGPAVVGQDSVNDASVVVVVERVVTRCVLDELSECTYAPVGYQVVQVARAVASGAPVYPSRSAVLYFVKSSSMRSAYVTSVYRCMLCSAKVRAWASCLYSIHRWGARLGGYAVACSGSSAALAAATWCMLCTEVHLQFFYVGVESRWTSPVAAVAGMHVAVCA